MTLPRFTAGRVGNLEFSHLNEAFDLLEDRNALEARRRQPTAAVLLAQLTQENAAGEFAWTEVVRSNDGSYTTVQDGIASTSEGNAFAFAAISLNRGAEVGDIVAISPRRTSEGKLFYVIQNGSGTVTRSFKIVQSLQHATRNDMWAYKGRLVTSSIQSGYGSIWTESSALEYVLLNGAENASDASSTIGVGTRPPTGVQAVRNPIKVGTIVLASNVDGDWHFSMPNGYTFTCP